MKRMALLAVVFLALCAPVVGAGADCELVVTAEGFDSDTGQALIGLFNGAAGFPDVGAAATGGTVPIAGGRARAVFTGLAPGRYAVAVIHDADGDGQLDTNFMGVPREQYGFSNNARGFLKAPGFDEAAFDLREPSAALGIMVK